MRRGELYRVRHPSGDPKRERAFVVVSRQVLIDSRYSTVICAPVYSSYNGLASEIRVGPPEGLKHESSIHCDALVSLRKEVLTNYIGYLSLDKRLELSQALAAAVGIREDD